MTIDSATLRQMLHTGAQSYGLDLTAQQLDAFDSYRAALQAWNERTNLTRITDPAEIITKHFLDSLSVYPALADLLPNLSLIDVGTGAGFPGLPLKLALPQMRLTLVESVGKKTEFLIHCTKTLALSDVTILTARAEDVGRDEAHRAQYDVAVARAVASLPVLAEYLLPLVRVGGRVIAQKGAHPAEEIAAAEAALAELGGTVEAVRPIEIPHLPEARHLVLLEKTQATPDRYPRRAGMPTKRPL